MNKAQSFIIPMGTYPFDVFFSINQTEKQFQKDLSKFNIEFEDSEFYASHCRARTSRLETGQTVVRFKDFRSDSFWHGIVAHEIWHVVEFLFLKIGMPHSEEFSSEAYAYQIQYLTFHFYEDLQ